MFPVADEEGDVVARIKTKIKELILKLARKNRSWGYPRIQGALTHLRPDASRGTIAKGLKVNELEPALTRGGGMTWRGFLKAYWKVLTAKGTKPIAPYQHKFDNIYLFGAFSPTLRLYSLLPVGGCFTIVPLCSANNFVECCGVETKPNSWLSNPHFRAIWQ